MATGQTAYVDSDSEVRRFVLEAMNLRADYLDNRTPPEELERKWWELSVRLYNSPAFDNGPRNILVDVELGLSLNWRASLANYRAAFASENLERIDAARADLARADELTDELVLFVR